MTTLDLATVILLHKTSLLAGASALLLLWWRADRPPGVLAIAVSFLLLALGSLMAGLGQIGAIPAPVWQDTSIAIAVSAYGQLYLGARRLDQPIRRARRILLAAPALLAVGLLTSLFHDDTVRATAFHVVGAVACAAAAFGLARHARAEPLSSRLPLASALAVSAAVYGLQVPLLLSGLATSGSIALGFAATMMLNFVIAALVVSMVRERREEVQRRVSITDALTGVLNRHGFLSHVPDRIDPPGALILFDLDHFKRINDRFGHAVGDLALQGFARLVRARLGAGDVVARLGGEEFVVFLENGTGGRAARFAEDISSRARGLADPMGARIDRADDEYRRRRGAGGARIAAASGFSRPPTRRSIRPRRAGATASRWRGRTTRRRAR